MKKTLLLTITLLFLGLVTSSAQIYRLRTTAYAVTSTDENGTWEDWSDWTDISLLVTLDIDNVRVTIYSDPKEVYDVIDSEEGTVDADGDSVYKFTCLDKDGVECTVKFMQRDSQDDKREEIYITYDDVAWVYKVYSLDDE
jgi:hypothetical protein